MFCWLYQKYWRTPWLYQKMVQVFESWINAWMVLKMMIKMLALPKGNLGVETNDRDRCPGGGQSRCTNKSGKAMTHDLTISNYPYDCMYQPSSTIGNYHWLGKTIKSTATITINSIGKHWLWKRFISHQQPTIDIMNCYKPLSNTIYSFSGHNHYLFII